MRTWLISITIIVLFSVNSNVLAATREPDVPNVGPAASTPDQGTVRIIHSREQHSGRHAHALSEQKSGNRDWPASDLDSRSFRDRSGNFAY